MSHLPVVGNIVNGLEAVTVGIQTPTAPKPPKAPTVPINSPSDVQSQQASQTAALNRASMTGAAATDLAGNQAALQAQIQAGQMRIKRQQAKSALLGG